MRRALLVALIAAAGPAGGQSSVGIAGGVTAPSGDLASIDNAGFHAAAMFESIAPQARVGFRVDASLHMLGRKATIQDITDRIIAGTADAVLKAPPSGGISPYFLAGLGMYSQTTSPRPVASTASTDMGFNLGFGARLRAAGASPFIEVRYHRVLAAGGARFVPVSLGFVF